MKRAFRIIDRYVIQPVCVLLVLLASIALIQEHGPIVGSLHIAGFALAAFVIATVAQRLVRRTRPPTVPTPTIRYSADSLNLNDGDEVSTWPPDTTVAELAGIIRDIIKRFPARGPAVFDGSIGWGATEHDIARGILQACPWLYRGGILTAPQRTLTDKQAAELAEKWSKNDARPAAVLGGRGTEISRRVTGYCPMGCGATLAVTQFRGHVYCTNKDCPRQEAASEILHDTESDHLIYFTDHGWRIKHPVRERLDDVLLECEVGDIGLRLLDTVPPPPDGNGGPFRIREVQDGAWTIEPADATR